MTYVTAATIWAIQGRPANESHMKAVDQAFRQLQSDYPQAAQARFDEYADRVLFNCRPLQDIEVERPLEDGPIRRVIEPYGPLFAERAIAILQGVVAAFADNEPNVRRIIKRLGDWMVNEGHVRIAAAGRALQAALLAAHRLSHTGCIVSAVNTCLPVANSRLGGGLLAASASGKTKDVLAVMARVRELNVQRRRHGFEELTVVGISDQKTREFEALCSPGYFIGLTPQRCQLRGLADIEEHIIAQVLDTCVMAAAYERGINPRLLHEDLGPTGPHHQHKEP